MSSSKEVDFVHVEPYVPATQNLPEITPRVIILGIFLAVLLAGSSTFMGLKIARTIAGSIPAALVSMMILRRLKNANILENNMVQTIASAGETIAGGVIFVLPALILIGYWQSFDYLQTTTIIIIGGVLGVIFSVPLRQNMVVRENLPYPEGLATAEVLKSGEDTKSSTHVLLAGSLLSTVLAFLQTGFKIAGDKIAFWTKAGSTAFGASLTLSPVLMGAGYIVGMRGLIAFVAGGIITWAIGIPIMVALQGLPEGVELASALIAIQKDHFRFVGVGVFAVGGVWCVISLIPQIRKAIASSFAAMKMKGGEFAVTPRTERDIPFKYVLWGIVGISLPTLVLFFTLVDSAHFGIPASLSWATILFATLATLILGFVCAAVAAYIVGIVGTTSLPVSGLAITTIIALSAALLWLLGGQLNFSINTELATKAAGLIIIVATIIAVSVTMSGDNMQDLKAGQIVGSTPWKQQFMLIIGAVASALVIPLILQTTFNAYGIGDVLPRAGMDPNQALPAPQATLMATLVQGFFGGHLPWKEIAWGGGLAVLAIILDEYLRRTQSGYRFPSLLLALGIYLPLGTVMAFFIGGLINWLVSYKLSAKAMHEESNNAGILFASGLIAGEAILGAILTIPFAVKQSTDVFALHIESLIPYQTAIGVGCYLVLGFALYKYAVAKKRT